MTRTEILTLLEALGRGDLTAEVAADLLAAPSPHLDFAHLDLERPRRTGLPEVVFGQGKTAAQIAALMGRLHQAGQVAIATRVDDEKAAAVLAALPEVQHLGVARVLLLPAPGEGPRPAVRGPVAVVCAGTSDLPVAEEAAVVLEAFGHPVERVRDVGVAGIHRLLEHLERLRACSVLVVVAGMEGALPSVVAGLVGRPVIAVPTSVGYGASFGGVAALLGMLNSCAPGLSVVNIDNGFGAACQAALINLAE
ncbi:MAG: nickel pincer cofactor biosynthesis protein LarB [Pseudomonadota bacterium]